MIKQGGGSYCTERLLHSMFDFSRISFILLNKNLNLLFLFLFNLSLLWAKPKLNWNTRLFTTVFTTKLCFGALGHFQSWVLIKDSALKLCRPNLLTQMSALKSVAFIKTWKNLVDREETDYYGGQRRHLLTLYQVQHWGIWGTEGPGIFQSVFLVLLLSPTQTTKAPLREPPFFFSEQAHKASCTRLQLSSTEKTTSSYVLMHLFQVILPMQGSKSTLLHSFTSFLIPLPHLI